MGNSVQLPPPGFDDLSVEEQLEYVEALWNRIAESPERVPVPDWHRRVIKERLAAGSPSRPWDEVRRDVEQKLGLQKGCSGALRCGSRRNSTSSPRRTFTKGRGQDTALAFWMRWTPWRFR